jgi:hypothetical protein
MHGDEPGTDLDKIDGEPVRQQGQQGCGDQEQCIMWRDWNPVYAHPSGSSHQAPPGMRKNRAWTCRDGVPHAGQDAEAAVVCVRSVTRRAPWSIWSRIWRVDGKPIECREMLKNDTVSKDASFYMAILHGHAAHRAQPSKTFNPASSTQNFQEPNIGHPRKLRENPLLGTSSRSRRLYPRRKGPRLHGYHMIYKPCSEEM